MTGRRSRWAVMLVLAFLAAMGLSILLLWPSGGTGRSQAPAGYPVPLPLKPSAREAYRSALEAARVWQEDAQLASLSAHLQQVRGGWPSQCSWMVQFYSPATGRIALIAVEAGRARLLQERLSPYPLPVFHEGQWRVDSPQALEIWWTDSGADFLARHNGVEVTLQLGPASPTSTLPIWTITAVAGSQIRTFRLSAVDGRTNP